MCENRTDLTIGLMGSFVHNENMGCVALTYSLVQLLEDIAAEEKKSFHYILFEFREEENRIALFCEQLKLKRGQVEWAPVGKFENIKVRLKNWKHNRKTIKKIKECNVVVDLSLGDSFADIYGEGRFLWNIKMKEMVEKKGIPLILGPQTYGPFQKDENKSYAGKIIEKASLVIARDEMSADYIKSFAKKDVAVTTDLAFRLPYKTTGKEQAKIQKIGINISSLLLKNKKEATKKEFEILTDYDVYIENILKYILEKENVEVHLIPHVGEDGGKSFAEKYPEIIVHEPFVSPIDAKNLIADMDVFIGSRMHATVAAFSAGVVTIPVGYSRKFVGLYENLGYPYVIDMQKLSTDKAVESTKKYLQQIEKLSICQKECMSIIEEKSNLNKKVLKDFLF